MKKFLILLLCSLVWTSNAQIDNSLDVLLAAGVEDTQRFANDYLKPGTNGLMHSMNANWFNTAKVKPLGGFEISIIGNYGPIKDEKKSFLMNTEIYNNVEFLTGENSQKVSTVLGENNPDVEVLLTYEDPIFGNQQVSVTLPSGLGAENIDFIPTAVIQGALGISNGLEVKARFVPNINVDDVDFGLYGGALQAEFTKWLSDDIYMPVAISGLIAYTKVNTTFDITNTSGIAGENQRVENDTSTWLFQLIGSTKLPIINFYGGIGFISGTSDSGLKGTYIVTDGNISADPLVDPFSVSSKVSDLRGTLGTKLKLGVFRLNAEYQISDFNVFSVGMNFGFR
ncbi:DUF6588 family protein [uncultured Algibacter sp.]|uniref:DUF6588 family protein n=1 Tax=uncultured Algibacter sp. TaxID=298659 RepID=UPI00261D192F|nr:DUF6588 family protein [uncultured Algibacter sp.]